MGKTYPVFITICIVCVLCFANCATSSRQLRDRMNELAEKEEIVIVVYGDEISGGEESFFIANTYASMLKPRLIELWGKRISMINSSEIEESFRLASRRMQQDILSFRPDIVFIMLGRIDAYTSNMSVFLFKEYVEDFLGELKHENVFVVLLTTPGLRNFIDAPAEEIYLFDEFVQVSKNAARLYHYPVIDIAAHINKVLKDNPEKYESLFSDNSHLSEDGKIFVADIIYDALSKATIPDDN